MECLDETHPAHVFMDGAGEIPASGIDLGHEFVEATEHDRHHHRYEQQRQDADQGQGDADRQQVAEHDHRPGQVQHQLRQVVGQEQLQLFDALVHDHLDLPGAPLIEGAQGHLSHMLRDHAPHLEQGVVRPPVGGQGGKQGGQGLHRRRCQDNPCPLQRETGGTRPLRHGVHYPVKGEVGDDGTQTGQEGHSNGGVDIPPVPPRPGHQRGKGLFFFGSHKSHSSA